MARDCSQAIVNGAAVGGALGVAIGTIWGSWEALKLPVPFLYRLRHVGQTSVQSAAMFGLCLGAGAFINCGRY